MVEDSDVVVVGAGPVGSFAALSLRELGLSVRVIDAEGEQTERTYTCGLHPETLRLFDELSLGIRLPELGHRVDLLRVYRGAELIAEANLSRLGGPFPHVLTLLQMDVDDTLAVALEEKGVDVLWQHEMTELKLTDDGVEVIAVPRRIVSEGSPESRHVEQGGERRVLGAPYVIAADGYYSSCREGERIEWIDLNETETFALFEVSADLRDFQHEGAIVFAGDSLNAFWPLGPERGRWMFQVWKHLDAPPTLERLRSLLEDRAPWFDAKIEHMSSGSIMHFDRLLASRLGRDRIWLAGDAAHVTSPIGYQSMNVGFVEARELALALRDPVSRGESALPALRELERARQLEWGRLLGIDKRIVSDGRLSPAEGRRLVPCLPASGPDLDAVMTMLGLRFG